MKLAAVAALAAGACAEPVGVEAIVVATLPSDDPAAALVEVDVELALDDRAVPLADQGDGHYVAEPLLGFPRRVVVRADGESRELAPAPFFTAKLSREPEYISITFDPPIGDGQQVRVVKHLIDLPPITRIRYPGATNARLPPGYGTKVEIAWSTRTALAGDGVALGGEVIAVRELEIPRWAGDP